MASILDAFSLLFSANKELWDIILVSIKVSSIAILISTPIAFLSAFVLANYNWRYTRIAISITHTLVAVPAVVVGLIIYLLLSKQGMLANLHWLFSQKAMILGQILLAFPIVLNISYSGFNNINKKAKETAITLGANYLQVVLTLMFECRFVLITAITMAFGRIIAEVGSAMMVGGNILHYTRNITTAIALETNNGDFIQGIALGIVLIFLALLINFSIVFLNKKSYNDKIIY